MRGSSKKKHKVQIKAKTPAFDSVFSWKEAEQAGVSRRAFQRMLKEGEVFLVRRGYYVHKKSGIPADEIDFAIACKHFGPSAAIGGMTALFYYGLTENVPQKVWVLVPAAKRHAPKLFRCIRTSIPLDIGVAEKKYFRIATIERAIVDAFKFSTKLGLTTAIKAAKTAVREKKTTVAKIAEQAKEMGLLKIIHRNWEAITL